MGEHIHFKDGKFNVWSNTSDSYVYDKWLDKEAVRKEYVASRLYRATLDAIEQVNEGIDKAEANKGCSIRIENLRCSKT